MAGVEEHLFKALLSLSEILCGSPVRPFKAVSQLGSRQTRRQTNKQTNNNQNGSCSIRPFVNVARDKHQRYSLRSELRPVSDDTEPCRAEEHWHQTSNGCDHPSVAFRLHQCVESALRRIGKDILGIPRSWPRSYQVSDEVYPEGGGTNNISFWVLLVILMQHVYHRRVSDLVIR